MLTGITVEAPIFLGLENLLRFPFTDWGVALAVYEVLATVQPN
jgi:hypothetical protein